MPDRSGTGWAVLHSVRVENPWLAEEACGFSNRSTTNAVAYGMRDDSELRSDCEKRRMKSTGGRKICCFKILRISFSRMGIKRE